MDELERAVERWLTIHAPGHRGHHVQVGGGAVICRSCGMIDLTIPEQGEPADPVTIPSTFAAAV